MQYDVQYYNTTTAVWVTLHTFETVTPALAEFERRVEAEHDPEVGYRVVQTEIVNSIIRQS